MSSCSTNECGVGGWGGPLPGDPSNDSILTATPAFGGIDLNWTFPVTYPEAVAYTKVYRAAVSNPDAAILIKETGDTFWHDRQDNSNRWYYWIRFVSVNGTVGELIGPASATAKPTIQQIIEQLTGQIDQSVLAQALKTELARINTLDLGLFGEIKARENGETTLSEAMQAVQDGNAQTLTFLAREQQSRVDGDSALATSIEIAAVTAANNLAAATTVLRSEIQAGGGTDVTVLSERIETVAAQSADDLAAAQNTLTSKIDRVDGRVDSLGSALTAVESGSRGTELVNNSKAIPALGNEFGGSVILPKNDPSVPPGAPSDYVYVWDGRDGVGQMVSCVPNEVFDIECWVGITADVAANVDAVGIISYQLNAAGTNLFVFDGGRIVPTVGWHKVSGTIVANGNAVQIAPVIWVNQAAGGPGRRRVYYSLPSFRRRSGAVSGLAQAQTNLETHVSTVDGKVTEIGALWTAKVSVDGLIGGFGVYNDGRTVVAGFDVDQFWIGKSGVGVRKPFIVDSGYVYIDDAAINKLTFSKLRDESGSFIVQDGKVKANYLRVDSLDALTATIGFLSNRAVNSSGQRVGQGVDLSSGAYKVFDSNGVLRVQLGDLSL